MRQPSTRSQPKQSAIAAAIRERIVTGVYAPGALVPRRADLQAEFAVSRTTMQQVFDDLQADGFIATNGRGGTIVVERPPHQYRIGLGFPHPRAAWGRFWNALESQARLLAAQRGLDLVVYADLENHNDHQGYDRLLEDARAQRMAGVIFAAQPPWGPEDPMMQTGMPMVGISLAPGRPEVPTVYPDQQSFIDRAVERFVAEGCNRIAVIAAPGWPVAALTKAMAQAGLEVAIHRLQVVPIEEPQWADNAVRLLFHADHQQQPDGLLICDDNMVEHGLSGLIASGAHSSGQVRVIAHANYPCLAPSVLPIDRLGYEINELLDVCLAQLAHQRAGTLVNFESRIAAHFADHRAQRSPLTA